MYTSSRRTFKSPHVGQTNAAPDTSRLRKKSRTRKPMAAPQNRHAATNTTMMAKAQARTPESVGEPVFHFGQVLQSLCEAILALLVDGASTLIADEKCT